MKIKTKRGARRIRNQRVIDRRFVVTDYDGCSYITAGKLYRLRYHPSSQYLRTITTDINIDITISLLLKTSAHLNHEGTWYHPIR